MFQIILDTLEFINFLGWTFLNKNIVLVRWIDMFFMSGILPASWQYRLWLSFSLVFLHIDCLVDWCTFNVFVILSKARRWRGILGYSVIMACFGDLFLLFFELYLFILILFVDLLKLFKFLSQVNHSTVDLDTRRSRLIICGGYIIDIIPYMKFCTTDILPDNISPRYIIRR